MVNRAWARPRVLQHAGRAIAVALLAAIFLASASPAGAWQSYWQQPAPPASPVEANLGNVPFTWVGFDSPSDFSERIALSGAATGLKASMAPPVGPSATGDTIASTALAYVGYPYVYAGAGPGGFDCSGFTQYIVGITTGIWMSHAVEAQAGAAGTWVDYGNWQPGDLIYFQNTYRAGISHAAIYIGDGLIVHAENESTGVTIDSIYSSYYGPRYWGAYRIG
ncbi:MAG: C40 family peptidase [Thermomicrobiales bacterium]